ncbi:Panacea domain-containing protein [Leptospira wolffii]|uniref:Panacea domain-containing protein n=1 Tax=Leptospira wolffii TaxID=409998 RepID=UPI00030E8E05|nr:type II toxin-antitoxin system antitoxin SocA domain-containing protein [Leptospira wolffii]EPG66005.1 PF13274 family protein [Leptospira wolffii serovar Khorat str. Khorat-H2]
MQIEPYEQPYLNIENPANIDTVIELLVSKGEEIEKPISILKLHKLLYYIQAWVHGPASRPVFDKFKKDKGMYDSLTLGDITRTNSLLSPEILFHVNEVLDVYMKYSGSELEDMTHKEDPWLKARADIPSYQSSENYIQESDMTIYYRARLV